MSSANLDLVRSIYAAWGRGDFTSVDWADPDIEFVQAGTPNPGRWTGPSDMAERWREWLNAWKGYRAEAEEYRELDGERVLVLGRMSGRGKMSGVDVETRFATLVYIRECKVTRLVLYPHPDQALADLGLTPDTGT